MYVAAVEDILKVVSSQFKLLLYTEPPYVNAWFADARWRKMFVNYSLVNVLMCCSVMKWYKTVS